MRHIHERGISRVVVAVALVVLVAVGAGAYLFLGKGGPSAVTSTTSQGSTTTSSTSSGNLDVFLGLEPSTPLASSDVTANYTLSFSLLSGPGGPMDFNASGASDVTIRFDPSVIPDGTASGKVTVSLLASASAPPGVESFNITADQGGARHVQTFQFQVVKYLVVTVGDTFVPSNMTVSQGSTVYWMRTNGAISQYDNGQHNVDIRVPGAVSPTLAQYESWSYVFAQPGGFSYYCTYHPSMTGEIVVSPA